MLRKIAVDIDDVLARNAEGFVAYSNQRWGMQLTAEDYNDDWLKVWRVDLGEAKARAKDYFQSGAFREFAPRKEALPVLKILKKRFELVIITSRQHSLAKQTSEWIDEHFTGIFSELHYTNIWRADLSRDMVNQTKTELCQQVGAEYLIDDQTKHCFAAAQAGITALLFGEFAWNRSAEMPNGVVRVRDWEAVEAYFKGVRK